MQFVFGYIIGIATASLILVIMTFFRAGIEKRVKIIETKLVNAGPRPKGAIIMPEDEDTEARREIIKKNKEAGRDTPISDLL